MQNRGIFITATDTEVGKTFVSCALAAELAERGINVGVSKPFASGGRKNKNGMRINDDAKLLSVFSGSRDNLEWINPSCMKYPLAPDDSARIEGESIDVSKVLVQTRRLVKKHEMTIIEGCGGLLVPIYKKVMLIDVIDRLGVPVVLVARAGLGTINHTLLSLQALKNRKIPVKAIILNQCEPTSDLSMRTNVATIERHSGLPVLGPIPKLKNLKLSAKEKHKLAGLHAIGELADILLE